MGNRIQIPIINNRLRLNVFVVSPHIKNPKIVLFFIDTGSADTIISQPEAEILGIDLDSLKTDERPLGGFGEGTVQAKQLSNVFLSINGGNRPITVELDLILIGMKAQRKDAKKNHRIIPNVLGVDFLTRSGLILTLNMKKSIAFLDDGD